MEGWKRYNGRKVYVILKNNRSYSGVVIEVNKEEHLTFITIEDKFNKNITFLTEEIKLIQEER